MKFEFDTDDVKGWIVDCAEEVWDYYETNPEGFDVSAAVWECVDGYFFQRSDCLAVIAYYALEEKCFGGCLDYEDSPYAQFENDVYEELPFVFRRHGKRFENDVVTDLEEE